jgi:opacity protein-like surface antigen
LGIEADGSAGQLNASAQTAIGTGPNIPVIVGWTESVYAFATLRGRIGYITNNWLFYATGGFAWSYDQFTCTQLTTGPASPVVGLIMSNTPTRTGWAAGGGVEWGFGRNWTVRVEYLRLDLGDEPFGNTALIGLKPSTVRRTFTIDDSALTLDTVRVGLNFQFK